MKMLRIDLIEQVRSRLITEKLKAILREQGIGAFPGLIGPQQEEFDPRRTPEYYEDPTRFSDWEKRGGRK